MNRSLAAMAVFGATAASVLVLSTPAVASCCTNSGTSSTTGATAKYWWDFDEIEVTDTKADGFSVYANFKIAGGTTNSTSQCNAGYNGGHGNFCDFPIGPLESDSQVKIRAARDVEGAANNYGSWTTGYS